MCFTQSVNAFVLNRIVGLLLLCLIPGGEPGAFLRAAKVPADGAEPAGEGEPAAAAAPTASPAGNGFHDPSNPDFARLQRPEEALQGLPTDANGAVDWASALRRGLISPREVLSGAETFLPLDLDVIMRNTKAMPYVRFPHKTHTEWLACSNCHPRIFAEKAGSSAIRMEDIFRGRFCGECHDRVAFITHKSCFRCHSVAQPAGATGP